MFLDDVSFQNATPTASPTNHRMKHARAVAILIFSEGRTSSEETWRLRPPLRFTRDRPQRYDRVAERSIDRFSHLPAAVICHESASTSNRSSSFQGGSSLFGGAVSQKGNCAILSPCRWTSRQIRDDALLALINASV